MPVTRASTISLSVPCLNPCDFDAIHGDHPGISPADIRRFAGISGRSPGRSYCLPCRRSWVRIPSAAFQKACVCRSFPSRQSGSAYASLGTDRGLTAGPSRRPLRKTRLCRHLATTRTTDLLRPGKVKGSTPRTSPTRPSGRLTLDLRDARLFRKESELCQPMATGCEEEPGVARRAVAGSAPARAAAPGGGYQGGASWGASRRARR
jgi:hypothetical protein